VQYATRRLLLRPYTLEEDILVQCVARRLLLRVVYCRRGYLSVVYGQKVVVEGRIL